MKRIISLIMVLVLALSLVPTTVWATEGTPAADVASVTDGSGETQKFASLQEAFEYVAASDVKEPTVTLLTDTKEDVTIKANVTFDLGGKVLTGTGTVRKATLTVAKDVVAAVKNGSVKGTANGYYNIQNNGTATLENVTATAGNNGSSMIDNWGDLTITSGEYSGGLNVVKSGKTLTIANGTLNITGGICEGTLKTGKNGEIVVTGGTFSSNPADYVHDEHYKVSKGLDGMYTVGLKDKDDGTGGKTSVQVPYQVGLKKADISVYYLNNGKTEKVPFTYDAETGIITMTLEHFSAYLITTATHPSITPVDSKPTYIKGSNKDLGFTTVDLPEKITVKVGDKTLTEGKDYTVSDGKLTLTGAYLETLDYGNYTLKVFDENGNEITKTSFAKSFAARPAQQPAQSGNKNSTSTKDDVKSAGTGDMGVAL